MVQYQQGHWGCGGQGAVARGKPPNGVIVESRPAQTSGTIHLLALNEVPTEYSMLNIQQQHSLLSILQSTLCSTCF